MKVSLVNDKLYIKANFLPPKKQKSYIHSYKVYFPEIIWVMIIEYCHKYCHVSTNIYVAVMYSDMKLQYCTSLMANNALGTKMKYNSYK